MTLSELSRKEDRLRTEIEARGFADDKLARFTDTGLFEAYRGVHFGYAHLGTRGNLEALKRALFIQWIAVVEPPFLTGIRTLDAEAEYAVLAEIGTLHPDRELRSMLAWMLSTTNWYFQALGFLETLQSHIDHNDLTTLWRLNPAQFEGRGQMGRYFQSILEQTHSR